MLCNLRLNLCTASVSVAYGISSMDLWPYPTMFDSVGTPDHINQHRNASYPPICWPSIDRPNGMDRQWMAESRDRTPHRHHLPMDCPVFSPPSKWWLRSRIWMKNPGIFFLARIVTMSRWYSIRTLILNAIACLRRNRHLSFEAHIFA